MVNLMVQIFATDLLESFEHYKRAFNATKTYEGYGDHNELIHLEFDVYGHVIAIAPAAPHEIAKIGDSTLLYPNMTYICLTFKEKDALLQAYNVLKESGKADELVSVPWSALNAYITDKFGVSWYLAL